MKVRNLVSISYIIPTFNNLTLLKRCISSFEPQLKVEDKVIIVDDGSTDGTIEYLKEKYLDNDNFIILTQKNSGSGSARNYGMKSVETDYIWFVDADDYIVEHAAEKVKTVLKLNTYDLLYVGYSIKKSKSNIENKEIRYNPDDKIEIFLTEHYPWNKIVKKDLFHNIYFPNENIRYVDHATIPIIISKAKNVGTIPEPLYIYNFSHSNNISKNKKKNKDIYTVFQYLDEQFKTNNLKKEELEVLYIKKFIYDEPYNVNLNFREIYSNLKGIRKYLFDHLPNWNKSLLLKIKNVSQYNHILKFPILKSVTGKIMSISPLAATIIIYILLLFKHILHLKSNLNRKLHTS